MMINEWPAILGSDGAGVVTEVGPDVTRLKVGDYVYSCAPIGQNRFTPFQDAYLAREDLLFKRDTNITLEDSCTIGVGLLTSSLCLLAGARVELPEDGNKAPDKDEWIVILGGSGNVGQFALGNVCGYKVLASCSSSKESITMRNGASATFNNRGTVDEQVAEILKITRGNFGKIMDASTYGYDVMVKALETASNAKEKYLTSVDSWSPFSTPSSINEYRADLGHLCRPNERDGIQITDNVSRWIPLLEKHIAAGTLKPLEHHVVDGVGWDKVIQGLQDMEGGKIGKKIVPRHIETTMEAIGVGASTLAFVLLALKSAKIINESLSSIKDAPRTVLELMKDVEFLQSVLGRISSCSLRHVPTSTIESLNGVLQVCTTELSSIECRLAKFSSTTASSHSSRMYKGVLAYVKKEDLENARGRIRDKSTQINLYLGLIQAQSLSEASSKIDTQATATRTILEQILGEVSKLHARLSQDAASAEVEQHTNATRDDDTIESTVANQLGTMTLCSELESSISRLATLVDHDGLTLDAEDAEQIIDDLRRFVVVAKEKSVANPDQDRSSVAYNIHTENETSKALHRDLNLIEGLILSAPIIAINQSVPGSRKLRSHLPHGTVIKQKRIREEIDVDHGYLTISTNKRRRICSGGSSDSSGNANAFRDVVANIVFRPSKSSWLFSVSLSQGQLFDRSIQSIPRISVCRIVPNDSLVFTLVKQGSLKELMDLLHKGKASLRDHDEQGMPLLHYAATASVEMCKFLIESGADVDEMGEHTGTALSRIAGLGRHDTTLVLLENMADPTLSYPGWDNPLSTACNLDLPSAELFLKHGGHFTTHDLESSDLNGRTRLHQVCMAEARSTSKQKAVAMLAAAGSNLDARVAKSWSPDDHQTLGFTCLHSLVYQANRTRDRDELEALVFLIRQGADVLAVDHHQHSVAMRACLPNDSDNQYSSKGSYRGDLWDAALTICGYDIRQHRDSYPRVPRYNRTYRRKDFERLWEGHEAACPYWNDERYPQTGGADDYWKQPVRRCSHVACSECEEIPAQTDETESKPKEDADIPVYAQPIYREWILARSPESNPTHFPYIDHITPEYDYSEGNNEESSQPHDYGESEDLDSDGGVQFFGEMGYQTMSELSPPGSEDGEAAYERLVAPYLPEEPYIDDYPAFVDRWLEHYIRAAEEEDEQTMNMN
ncbi:hypothetical protein FBEOM_5945 [Fusarium beomiforme]|uniref:Enoyl reductase (ER) domain-containing protein n=1 Tax=Fusarium beomiforme TaxID=44412 RepID=A0A9P5AJV1_9HYPO|nr:hypothetical protein FBEOM_5945 [Fusarium beomiforme]